MNTLIDTHTLLWVISDRAKLSPTVRSLFNAPVGTVWFSVASLWEIAIKVRKGKLQLDTTFETFAHTAEHLTGLQILNVKARHILAVHNLPHPLPHNDPFDHLLIAQALSEGLTLVSKDRRFRAYPAVPLVW